MTELQVKLFELLVEIDEICRKNDIKYSLFGGSALGAQRHKGFIPWDDDVDIIMNLENYTKLIKAIEKENKPGRCIDCLENDTGYLFTYARYVNTETTAIQRHTAFGGCHPGVKIDIFYTVPTSNDPDKANRHRLEILAFSEAISGHFNMGARRPEGFYPIFDEEVEKLSELGRDEYISQRLPQLKHVITEDTGRYVMLSGMMSNSYLLDSKIIDEVEDVPFESSMLMNSKFSIPFIKEMYGSGWLAIPPNVEKPRHTMRLDFGRPFGVYIDKLKEEVDLDQIKEIAIKRKSNLHYERRYYGDVNKNTQAIRNLAVKLETEKCFDLLSADEKKDYKILSDVLSVFYASDNNPLNRYYGIAINLRRDVFDIAVDTLIKTGRYYDAAAILKVENMVAYDAVSKRVVKLQETMESIYLGGTPDISEMEECATKYIAEFMLNGVSAGFDKKIDEAIECYGRLGEFLLIKGEYQEQIGNMDAADRFYTESIKNIRDAFLLQRLLDKGYDHTLVFKEKDSSSKNAGLFDKIWEEYDIDALEVSADRSRAVVSDDAFRKLIELSKNNKAVKYRKLKNGKETVRLYDNSMTAVKILDLYKGKPAAPCVTVGKAGNFRLDIKTVYSIVLRHVKADDFMSRVRKEGYLSNERIERYLEYQEWKKASKENDKKYLEYTDTLLNLTIE